MEPIGKSPSVLLVEPWVKLMMYLVCLVPVAFILWAMLRQALMPNGGLLVAALVALTVTVPVAGLFRRLYALCSISVSSQGISQSFLLHGGNLRTRIDVPWDQVKRASFSGYSYAFTTSNGVILELNTALFGDMRNPRHAGPGFRSMSVHHSA